MHPVCRWAMTWSSRWCGTRRRPRRTAAPRSWRPSGAPISPFPSLAQRALGKALLWHHACHWAEVARSCEAFTTGKPCSANGCWWEVGSFFLPPTQDRSQTLLAGAQSVQFDAVCRCKTLQTVHAESLSSAPDCSCILCSNSNRMTALCAVSWAFSGSPLLLHCHLQRHQTIGHATCKAMTKSFLCRITRAPAGSAVFETLSEELLEGKVVERLQVRLLCHALIAAGEK
jgi:hypothetical protein